MRRRLVAVAVLALTALLFAPVRHYPFVYEDGRDLDALLRPSQLVEQAAIYPLRSLSKLSVAVDSALFGVNARAFHLSSLAWHLMNVALALWLFYLVLPPWGAVLAAGLFAWHPVQVETVAYVSARPDLVAGCGLLLALCAASLGSLPGAIVGVVLASLAKETAVVAWGLVWLWAAWTRVPLSLTRWSAMGGGGALLLALVAFERIGGLTMTASPTLMGEQFAVIGRLVSLIAVPWGLTIDHDWSWPLVWWPVGFIGGVWMTAWAATSGWSRRSPLAFAWLWTVVALSPRLVVPLYEGLHEHHLYNPMIGWCLSAGHWVTHTRAEA